MWREYRQRYLAHCFILFAVITAVISNAPLRSPSFAAQAAESPSCDEVYKQVEEAVHQSYPRAKVTRTGNSMHFEFKVKQEAGFYANSGAGLYPQEGGLLGDLSIEPGEYSGERKLGTVPEGWHSTLTLAPYVKETKTHLLAVLVYPSDMGEDFLSRFKKIIDSYNNYEAATAPPTPAVKTVAADHPQPASAAGKTETAVTPPAAAKNSVSTGAPWSSFLGTAGDGAAVKLPAETQLTAYRYLPGYPGRVKILSAKQTVVNTPAGHKTHVVDLTFFTADPIDDVCPIWVKRLGNEHWRLTANQPNGVIHGFVDFHVTDDTISSSGKWSSRSAALHDADVTIICTPAKDGTQVKVQYREPEQ